MSLHAMHSGTAARQPFRAGAGTIPQGNASRPCQPAILRAPRTVSSSGQPGAASTGAGLVSAEDSPQGDGVAAVRGHRAGRGGMPAGICACQRSCGVGARGTPQPHAEEPAADVQGPALRPSGALPRLSGEHRRVARFSRPGSRKATTNGWALDKKPSRHAQPALAAATAWCADCGHDQRRLCSTEKHPLRWLGIPPVLHTVWTLCVCA